MKFASSFFDKFSKPKQKDSDGALDSDIGSVSDNPDSVIDIDFSNAEDIDTSNIPRSIPADDCGPEYPDRPIDKLARKQRDAEKARRWVAAVDYFDQQLDIEPFFSHIRNEKFSLLRKLTDAKSIRRRPTLKSVRPVAVQVELFNKLFECGPSFVTDFDIRRYNKFLNDNKDDPAVANLKVLPLQPFFKIKDQDGWEVKHVSTSPAFGKDIRGTKVWDFVCDAPHGILLIKGQRDPETKAVNKTDFCYWSAETNAASTWSVDGRIRQGSLSSDSHNVVTIDSNFVLRVTDTLGTVIAEHEPPQFRSGRYEEGWKPLGEPQWSREDMETLGIASEIDQKKLRSAYIKKLRELHPDVNRNDPSANEKTSELISAYERLSGESSEDVLKEGSTEWGVWFNSYGRKASGVAISPNGRIFAVAITQELFVYDIDKGPVPTIFKIPEIRGRKSESEVEVEGRRIRIEISMGFDPTDWVNSMLVGDDSTVIYQTSSGSCVKVNIEGKAEFKAELPEVAGLKVFIASGILCASTPTFISGAHQRNIFSVKENQVLVGGLVGFGGALRTSPKCDYVADCSGGGVSLFGIDGNVGITIECKHPIRFAALTDAGLVIDAGPSQYIFEVNHQ